MQVSHKMAKQVSTGCFKVQVHRVFGMWPQRLVLRHPRPDSTSEHSLLFSEKLFMSLWLFLYNSMLVLNASIKTSHVNNLAVKTVLLLHYYGSIKTSLMVWNTVSTVQLTSISIVWIYYQPLLQQILTNSSFSRFLHSLGLSADLLHQLLDVILHELDFLLLSSEGLLQTDNALHKHGLVHLWVVVHHHHWRDRLAVWGPLFNTTAPPMACIQRAWGMEIKINLENFVYRCVFGHVSTSCWLICYYL